MAEINYNNLYNQLKPMEQRYYDQQFSKNYVPGQENIMLSSQPAYEQMKAAYEAQQEIPESGFFDSIFGSASAAEPPAIPNLSYRNITPTFDLGTGITNTSAATNMYTPFMSNQEMVNRDLVNQLIQENVVKANIFSRPNMMNVAGDIIPGGIMEIDMPYSGAGNMGYETPRTIADQNRVLGQTFTEPKKSIFPLTKEDIKTGIGTLLDFVTPGSFIPRVGEAIFGPPDPRVAAMRDFYGLQPGDKGTIQSGIMTGYNPISGGFLNFITGGRYGSPTNYGLQRSYQKRINMIEDLLARNKYKDPQKKRDLLAKLKEEKRQEAMALEKPTIDKARKAAPDVYREAERQGFTGPGGGFSTTGREGAFSSKSGRGRQDY